MSSARYAVNCPILFTELPLLERPPAARSAGFDAVEFWSPFGSALPGDAEVDAFERAIRDAGVRLTGLNFAAGDKPGGDRGLVSWPQRSLEFRDNVSMGTEIDNVVEFDELTDVHNPVPTVSGPRQLVGRD